MPASSNRFLNMRKLYYLRDFNSERHVEISNDV